MRWDRPPRAIRYESGPVDRRAVQRDTQPQYPPAERRKLNLEGLLPSGMTTLEGQLRRVYAQYKRQPDDLSKNVFLTNMRDRNEVLFYRVLTEHLEEMLPIVAASTSRSASSTSISPQPGCTHGG
jgi:hypothetical protein